ncbi:MAG: hypothetical protein KGL39_14775 [Patescibacteria group bacterium]|nr:hypothetical protein [Patescibacteria group bacterium]
MSAAGAGVDAYAQNQQLKSQDNAAAAGIMQQARLNKQAESDVGQTVKSVANSNAASAAEAAKQLAAYRAALQQSQGITASASPGVPGASKAYAARQAADTSSAQQYINALTNSAATTQGTQLERVQEGQQLAKTATNLGLLGQQSQNQDFLTKLQIQQQQTNPWLTALGASLKGAGSAYAFNGGLNPATAAPGVTPPSINWVKMPFNAGAATPPSVMPGAGLGSF